MTAKKNSVRKLKRQDSSSSLSSAEIDTNAVTLQKQPVIPEEPRKRVRFGAEIEIFDIPHLNNMSDKEVEQVWYNREEFVQIRAEYQVTVRIMSTARDLSDSDEHCTRGLEYRTRTGSRARQLNKLTAIAAVLDEQEHQYQMSCLDDEKLSAVYQHVSHHCREAALELGMNDAQDVYGSDYYFNTFGMIHKTQAQLQQKQKKGRIQRLFKQASLRRLQVLDDIKTIMRRGSATAVSTEAA